MTTKASTPVIDPAVRRVTARADHTQDMVRVAIFDAATSGQARYVVPTANGYFVDNAPAPAAACFRAEPDGRVFRIASAHEGRTETLAGQYRVVPKAAANGRTGLVKVNG